MRGVRVNFDPEILQLLDQRLGLGQPFRDFQLAVLQDLHGTDQVSFGNAILHVFPRHRIPSRNGRGVGHTGQLGCNKHVDNRTATGC